MYQQHQLLGNSFQLLCEKALYWEDLNWLIVADVHLGKSSHFRRNGFAVPKSVSEKTLDNLAGIIHRLKPERVLFLGDLFHSDYNEEWKLLLNLLDTFFDVKFTLVEGNHDILHPDLYINAGMDVVPEVVEGPFLFTHHPVEASSYNICGHVHPAVSLVGKGHQSLKLACFYFGAQQAILPAFGEFTGSHVLKPVKGASVFVCAKGEVIAVS